VAQNATGQYTTIEAAVTAANAAGSPANQAAVVVYPGSYDIASALVLERGISILASTPGTVTIASSTLSGRLITLKGSNILSGLRIWSTVGQGVVQITTDPGVTALIRIDRCIFQEAGAETVILDGGSTSAGGLLCTNSDFLADSWITKSHTTAGLAVGGYSWRFENCDFKSLSSLDVLGGANITEADGVEFYACRFLGLVGAANPSDILYLSSTGSASASVASCLFNNEGFGSVVSNQIYTDGALTLTVSGSLFEWANALGTQYDFSAAGTSTIQAASTVYDTGKTTTAGSGSIVSLNEGDKDLGDITADTLALSSSDSPVLSLEGVMGLGSQVLVDAASSGTVGGGGSWSFIDFTGASLDPTAIGSALSGLTMAFSGVDMTYDPDITGLSVSLPPTYGTGAETAGLFSGDGRNVYLCTDTANISINSDAATLVHDGSGLTIADATGGATLLDTTDFDIELGDTGGTNEFSVSDSGGTKQAAVDSDGNAEIGGQLTVGTTTGAGYLAWLSAGSSGISPSGNADELIIERQSTVGMSLLTSGATGASARCTIAFGGSADNDEGRVVYQTDTDICSIYAGGSEVVAFDEDNDTTTFYQERIVYSDTFWDDLRVPLTGISGPGSSGTAPGFDVFLGAVRAYAFDPTTDEELLFTSQLPHKWKEGTSIVPHIHWSPEDTNTGNVVWSLEYTKASINGTFGATTTISVTDAGDGTAYKHQVADFAAISMTGETISTILVCRLFRDADNGSDTYTGDAFGHEIDFHYEIDQPGSVDETTK